MPEMRPGTTPEETSPALVTVGLTHQLGEIRRRNPIIAKAFKGDINPLVDDIIARFAMAWQTFENGSCGMVSDSLREAETIINSWKTQSQILMARFRNEAEKARGAFLDDIAVAVREQVLVERDAVDAMAINPNPVRESESEGNDKPDDRTPLEIRRDEIAIQLEDEVIAATGNPHGHVSQKNALVVIYVGVGFAVLYGLAEWLGGLGFFRAIGTRSEAAGLTAMVVLGLSALADITAMKAALVLGVLSAWFSLKKRFPEGINEYGEKIHGASIDLHDIIICVAGLMLLFSGTLGLVFWRMKMAASNPLLRNTEIAAWIIFGAVLVNFLVILFISPTHKSDVVNRIHSLREKLEEATAQLEQGMKPSTEEDGENEGEPSDPIEAAKYRYRSAIEIADGAIDVRIAEITEGMKNALALYSKCTNVRRSVLATELRNTVADLVRVIKLQPAWKGLDTAQYTNGAFMGQIRKQLYAASPLALSNCELIKKIEEFKPILDSTETITQFQPIIDEIRSRIITELDAAEADAAAQELMIPSYEEEE